MEDASSGRKSGCGLLTAVFGRSTIWPRKSASSSSLQTPNLDNINNNNNVTRVTSTPTSKRRKNGSIGSNESFANSPSTANDQKTVDRIIERPAPNHNRTAPPPIQYHQYQQSPRKNQNQGQTRKVPQGALGISGELDSIIADHQLLSGNVMKYGNLGNLRSNANTNANTTNAYDYQPKITQEEPMTLNGKRPNNDAAKKNDEKPVSLCRALSTRMDPEELKILGNEDYKNGRFAEAVALYDAAISLDPNKASYRSNKSAALTAMGKLLEAAFECREAIRIDPFYQRAHNRLATLLVRLGEAEKATYHFKQSGQEADPDSMSQAKNVQFHLNKCTDAKKQRDWNTILRETALSIAAGADSAPSIFALKAEALLKLNKHQEAIETMAGGPDFDIDDCKRFFGPIATANLLVVRAQVDIAAGRFDEAVAAAQRALSLDGNNKEANIVSRRTKSIARGRLNGNEMFKAGRYSEACVAYTEGLNHDPSNAVLLGNRAACRSKLGQFDKAIEDLNAALNVRPGYSKARLRRADCYAKIEKWGACVQDCEVLMTENPDDEEVEQIFKEARSKLKKHGGSQDMSVAGVVVVSSDERYRDYVTSPGIFVVLFSNKSGDYTIMQLIQQLCVKYQFVNFLKVEAEDHPSLTESEGVKSLPAFIIYKNGSRAKEVQGDKSHLLESTIKYLLST